MHESDIALIKTIDEKIKYLLDSQIDDTEILVLMLEYMTDEVKKIITETNHIELNLYLQEYNGFYYYLKLFENMAQKILDGEISVPD